MESQSRWKFWRSKSKKKKNKKEEEWRSPEAVSCGTSTGATAATGYNKPEESERLYHYPVSQSTSFRELDIESRVPLYHTPHPAGYSQYVQRREDQPTLPTRAGKARHDSLHDVSVASLSDSAVAANCLQRSRSQPSVSCSPKKQRKAKGNKASGGDTRPHAANNAESSERTATKKGSLGSWLRKSLRRSKSRNDVSDKETKRKRSAIEALADQETRDEEEYRGGTSKWGRTKLTRSVSTGMVNSSQSSSLSTLLQQQNLGAHSNERDGLGRVLLVESPSMNVSTQRFCQGLSTPGLSGGGDTISVTRPYVLPTPTRPKQFPVPSTTVPTSEGHGIGVRTKMGQSRISQQGTLGQGDSTRSIQTTTTERALSPSFNGPYGAEQLASRLLPSPGVHPIHQSQDSNFKERTRVVHAADLQGGLSRRPPVYKGEGRRETSRLSQHQSHRPPLPERAKSPEKVRLAGQVRRTNSASSAADGGNRSSIATSPNTPVPLPNSPVTAESNEAGLRRSVMSESKKSDSRSSSDCPSGIAPTPPVHLTRQESLVASERPRQPGGFESSVRPMTEQDRAMTMSPVPSMSLASSVSSSVGVRRVVSRELPPLPPPQPQQRHSLASTVYSLTTSESVYHQINDANVGLSSRANWPGMPWQPPTVQFRPRSSSADLLDRPPDVKESKLTKKERRQSEGGAAETLKRAASQSYLDQVRRERYRTFSPTLTSLSHVQSACDLTVIDDDSLQSPRTPGQGLNDARLYQSNELLETIGERPENVRHRSKSQHDLTGADRSPRRSRKSRRTPDMTSSDAMRRHRSQPSIGGHGIQSRESVAFKPLSHTTSEEESLSSCSSDSDMDIDLPFSAKRSTTQRRRRRKRRPKRRSASYSNLPETKLSDSASNSRLWPHWPGVTKESSYMLRRWWATLDDIPTAVLRDGSSFRSRDSSFESEMSDKDVSMATTASYIPGVSLADKLRLAASKGQLDKVKELVAAGATFVPDREGRTALHYAALNGYADVVRLLAAEGCDIDLQDTLGYTALHRAAAQGHLEVIRALLAEGCLVDRQDEVHGNAALHEAAWNGYSKTLELLVKQRTYVNITNKAGFSALHLAAQNGHNQSARVLLYAGTNPDHKNNYGDSPLHTAARYGHAGVTRILVSAKANVNEQNKNGDTALHIAAALKRRKITKLLCDSPIDVNIRNKQNETAVDVARRKEHPEIILIITSKPKTKTKKSRFGRSKAKDKFGGMEKDGEKKEERRGFFFRKKKAKEKERSNPALTAASEISSSHYNPSQFTEHAPPAHLLAAFRDHQVRQQGAAAAAAAGAAGPGPGHPGAQTRGTSTLSTVDTVSGVMHQYPAKQGLTYYRDLAGNIRQGPVAYTPQCQCAPLVKRLETRVDADRANLYDHIDASHRTLGDRVEQLDRRMAQQVYSIDKLTKERLEAERKERQEQIENRALAERLETERQLEVQQDCIRTELKAWVDARLTGMERQYKSHDECCDYLLNSRFNMGRDGLHQTNLFRSRSDETLSVSSSHPGRKQSRLKSRAAHELKQTQGGGSTAGGASGSAAEGASRSHRREHRSHNRRSGLRVHDRPQSSSEPSRSRSSGHPENIKGRPLGHSPEGQSTKNDSFSEQGPPDRPLPEWIKPSPASSTPRHFDEAEGNSYNGGPPPLGARLAALQLSNVEEITDADTPPRPHPPLHFIASPVTPDLVSPVSSTLGGGPGKPFTVTAQVHHAKTDSGSNPDSGYGGRPYGGALRGRSGGTAGGSGGGGDQHDTSLATNVSTTTDGTSGTSDGDPLHVTRHFFDTVSAQMEKWYERRLKEVEKKAEDRVKQESTAMQSRIRALEERFSTDSVQLGPQIEASIGTQV